MKNKIKKRKDMPTEKKKNNTPSVFLYMTFQKKNFVPNYLTFSIFYVKFINTIKRETFQKNLLKKVVAPT